MIVKIHAEEAAYSALPGCCQYDRAADVKEILFKVRQHKQRKRK
jgi:hypothetical protein